jgi:hypothetical protein
MAEYDDTNTGVLFINDKEGNDKRPDYKGHINVEGAKFEVAAWKRVGKNSGREFLSLKIQDPEDRPQGSGYEKAKAIAEGLKKDSSEVDDEPISLSDIPF